MAMIGFHKAWNSAVARSKADPSASMELPGAPGPLSSRKASSTGRKKYVYTVYSNCVRMIKGPHICKSLVCKALMENWNLCL